MQQRVKTFTKGEVVKVSRLSQEAASEERLLAPAPTRSHTWKTVKDIIMMGHLAEVYVGCYDSTKLKVTFM